jgi:hypothetical protein
MSNNPNALPPFFHIDVSAASPAAKGSSSAASAEVAALLRQLVVGQERQNRLLEELVQQVSAGQRQKATELGQWRQAHPHLARSCRAAAEALSEVQTQFLQQLTEEVQDNHEHYLDGEFMLNEFVDRYGPRLAHLNGVLQMLSQLSTPPASNEPTQ